MEAADILRIRLGLKPEPAVERPDPYEVDRLCLALGWSEPYCALWLAYAAGLPTNDGDGHDMTWTRKQVKALLFVRHLYEKGQLSL